MHDYEHLVSMCNSKFFYAEANYSLAELDYIRKRLGEDLDIYVKMFHEKTLDRCDQVEERMLFNVCLHNMLEEYSILLKNLSLFLFQVEGGDLLYQQYAKPLDLVIQP